MNYKSYRLKEFVNPATGRSLIVETSAGLTLGPVPGLEKFSEAVLPILPLVEGVVASPGQARALSGRTREHAALLVRADWTNALRGQDFVLPPETVKHIPLLTPQDALDLSASAMVLYFLLGHEEEVEAACLRRSVQAAIEGTAVGMPLILDVQPIGPRVVLRSKAIELGVSYALEGGADGVTIPWPGEDSFKTIMIMAADMPVWIKPTSIAEAKTEMRQVIKLGGTGLWLGESFFAQSDPVKQIETLGAELFREKPPLPVGEEG
jgi:DhnA family fructose-bisphosphate aldolase class Ia